MKKFILLLLFIIPAACLSQPTLTKSFKELDSSYIYSLLLHKNNPILQREELRLNLEKYKGIFHVERQNTDYLLDHVIRNIFGWDSTIVLDSATLRKQMRQYNDFNSSLTSFGIPNLLRPDESIQNARNELQQFMKTRMMELSAWDSIYKTHNEIWPLEKMKNGVSFYRKRKLIRKINKIADQLENTKSLAGANLVNPEIWHWLKEVRVTADSAGRKVYVDGELRFSLYMLGRTISHEYGEIEMQIENLKNIDPDFPKEPTTQNNVYYSLFSLFRIDPTINYDVAMVPEQVAMFKSFISENHLDTVLRYRHLSIDNNGNFIIALWQNWDSLSIPGMIAFNSKFGNLNSGTNQKNYFHDNIFNCTNAIFKLPASNMRLSILGQGKMGGGKQAKYPLANTDVVNQKFDAADPIQHPCLKDYCANHITIDKADCDSNSPLLKYFSGSPNKIEPLIYDALKVYFKSLKLERASLSRIKIEEGDVFACLSDGRKIILKNENYWETIYFYIRAERTGDKVKICMRIEPRYGPGIQIGSIGDPPSSYKPMAIRERFHDPIFLYCSTTLFIIKDIITKQIKDGL